MKTIDKTLIIGINLGDYGSTGNIMRNSLEYSAKNGNYDYLVIVPRNGKDNSYSYMETPLSLFEKVLFHRILHEQNRPDGFYETPYTLRIINKIKKESRKYKNCFVHLHNIHMAHIDLRLLFNYLAKEKRVKKVFYTLHDEWSYTGGCYCAHVSNCDEWIKGCKIKCPQLYGKNSFPVSKQWKLKRKCCNILRNKLTIITVSRWLKNNVSQSFLKDFPTILNYGETSLDPFVNHSTKEKLKHKLGLDNKKVLLSVSAYWNDWKGVKYIYQIADKLPNNYVFLIIGGTLEKKHKNIIHIPNISQKELVTYYSIADVYISTSQNEALGLTTCEAQLCGTPVVAFGHTAIKETIIDGKTGIIVGEDNNVNKMIKSIIYIIENKPFKKENIIANGEEFKKFEHAKRMLEIYNYYNS